MHAPTFDAIFAVMAAVSEGDGAARVELPEAPQLDDTATRLAIALNMLLDDVAFGVAEQRKVEDRLRQSQKMEAIGNLAGGIAHDFNNMLFVILGFTDVVLEQLEPNGSAHADLVQVKLAAERARDLTRQLLTFSRRQVHQPRSLDPNAILLGMDRILRSMLGDDVEVALHLGSRLGRIRADPGQLEQVIMNLLVNARDAMPHGGKVTIETANVELSAEQVRHHPEVAPGPYVMLAVTDTGHGIPAGVRERIFEPFFTTKPFGQGTGLGLAIVFGIVRQSRGDIWVDSESGRGTTFKIYLPRDEQGVEDTAALERRPPPSRGSETVLLVEDDPQVRLVARTILRHDGYNVLEAPGATEALEIGERYSGRIHMLLTDVVMPGLSGSQLAERAVALRPELRVLYMSGYADHSLAQHGILDTAIDFVQKPITREALLRKIREVLDRE